jgi:hypothetical protein
MTSQTTQQQWIRTKDRRTGRQLAVAVPSKSTPNLYYLTTATTCDCKGFSFRRTCSHLEAVRAEIAARTAEAIIATPDTFAAAAPVDGSMAELARRERLVTLADSIWGVDGE